MALSFLIWGDLLGKPWKEDARGPDAYDCVGLAIEIQRRRGLTVLDFISSEAELHHQLAEGGFLAGCEKLDVAEPGCVALIRMGPHKFHLGTMLDRYRMLHARCETCGVVVERMLGSAWERRVMGFYLPAAANQLVTKCNQFDSGVAR